MPFKTAWTFAGFETALGFWSSFFPLFIAKTGVNGDEMAASSDDTASNFLEQETPCNSKRLLVKLDS